MKERLLVIRKEKLTVAQLDVLKEDDEARDIRSVLGYLIIVATEKFKTDLEFIDVKQVFDVVVDGRITLSQVSDEEAAMFTNNMLQRPEISNLVPFNPETYRKE